MSDKLFSLKIIGLFSIPYSTGMKNNAWFSVLSQFRPPIQNDYHDQQHEVWSSDKIDMPFGVRKEEFYPPRIETKFRPLTPSDQVLISGFFGRFSGTQGS